MTDDYLQRAAGAIEAGRLWRAKEILAGNLATRGYDRSAGAGRLHR